MSNWRKALEDYSHPCNLCDYEERNRFPGYFNTIISGDRDSTIIFEDWFRYKARESIEVYFEVIFLKLYSWKKSSAGDSASDITTHIVEFMLKNNVDPSQLCDAIESFTETPNLPNLRKFRHLLGLAKENGALAIALTFPAFIDPANFPMIDMKVVKWIDVNFAAQNANRRAKLTRFEFRGPSLQDNDFPNYLNWVNWCREMAKVLTLRTNMHWRARDVEMSVFTASKRGLLLEVL